MIPSFRWARTTGSAGFSILEVLVGTMLLAVVALLIFTAFAIGVRALALAGGMSTALGVAEETLAALQPDPCAPPSAASLPPQVLAGRDTYRRMVTIAPLSAPGQWEVAVTVRWTQDRRERRVSLASIRYIPRACDVAAR